jgi:hypothetical protein
MNSNSFARKGYDSSFTSIVVDDDNNNSILYFNVLMQQLQEPITESAQV